MKNKHKYYDVILAWASGEKVQFNSYNTGFRDFAFGCNNIGAVPDFNDPDTEWRIKPSTITERHRMALHTDGYVHAYDVTNVSLDDPIEYKIKGFVRWVGDVVEVEIEV